MRACESECLLRLDLPGQQLLGSLAGGEQFALIAMPVPCHEDGQVVIRLPFVLAAYSVHEDRQVVALLVDQIQLHLGDGALHPHQRRPMGVVANAAARCQQILDPPVAYQFLRRIAGPTTERLVHLPDRAVGVGQQQGARGLGEKRIAARQDWLFSQQRLRFGPQGTPASHRCRLPAR